MKPIEFDFITDEQFRSSLLNDYREMSLCQESGSWKAVHVLAGSIVEAVLVEYLVVSGTSTACDPLKMDLNGAIQACEAAGVIQKSTASLCDVIREYRNLIHAGRIVRLKQEVTSEGALIAVSLVSMIVREVAAKRKTTYGTTAEQIVAKLRSDEYSLAVLPHLLSESNEYELARLVEKLLPQAYFSELDFVPDQTVLLRFKTAYRQALPRLSSVVQARIAERFAKMVREESAENIERFSNPFFRAEQLKWLKPSDIAVVTTHLLTRLDESQSITDGLMDSLEEIGNFIPEADMGRFADLLIRGVMRQLAGESAERAVRFVGQVFDKSDEARQKIMEERIDAFVKRAVEKNSSEKTQRRLVDIQNAWLLLPF